ncbi:small secreted protein [Streptomyces sp. NPDC047022]|uniref:small secreted protein n=1 Tax=Streptomyces sp. NPDC047022 TaxID=3155737 RepID=UPI003410D590
MEGTDPVNKKFGATLSGGAVLVLALSGCTSSKGATTSAEDKLGPWVKQVCDAVQPQATKIAAATAAIQKETSDSSPPEQVQKTDTQAFQDISDAYKSVGAAVEKAGAPQVEGGATQQKNVVAGFNGLSASYIDLKKKMGELSTKDQAKFAQDLKGFATQLSDLSTRASDVLKQLEAGDVGKAMQQQQSCKAAPPTASSAAPSASASTAG